MAHTSRTLALDPGNWDLTLTAEGNLRLFSGGMALAQDCANEIRLWRDDAYFQKDNGIRWKEVQLAKKLDDSVLRSVLREACMKVPGVKEVRSIDIGEIDDESRTLHGEIKIITTEGQNGSVTF